MTNDDLNELNEYITKLKIHREEKAHLAGIETEKHSWPYPDTKKESLNG